MQNFSVMNIGILGLGSLGSLMAYHWREHSLFALSRQSHHATHLIVQNQTHIWQAELPYWQGEPLDWLVVCTKAADTLNALQQWQHLLPNTKKILLLQNGMGQQQQVMDWLERLSLNIELWAGVCTEGAYRDKDKVIYAGVGTTVIGVWSHCDANSTTANTNELSHALDLPHTQVAANIEEHLLNKLAINAVINPLTAYYRCKNGELVSNPDYKKQLISLSKEISGLYKVLGWPLNQSLTELTQQVAVATAANTSSTLQDIFAQRTTELPFISGYLLEQAQALAYDLPLTQQFYSALI